ncbi:hypothetical protein RRG08_036037 [Elysia crispata]|uniref:Uncharacterized protein n=1 Tax=Elysia crispata TaxID=231223 RepID=A0AAE1AKY5_9GAST|nr:hypothetical protein RRG08_036037 [Elysia crispata]
MSQGRLSVSGQFSEPGVCEPEEFALAAFALASRMEPAGLSHVIHAVRDGSLALCPVADKRPNTPKPAGFFTSSPVQHRQRQVSLIVCVWSRGGREAEIMPNTRDG